MVFNFSFHFQIKHIKMVHSPKAPRELMSPPLPLVDKRSPSPLVIVNGNKMKEIPIKVTIPAGSGYSSGSK